MSRRIVGELVLAVGLFMCWAAPTPANAAFQSAEVSWQDGGRGDFQGRLEVNGFRLVDGRFQLYGRLVGTTSGRHATGAVDQPVEPWVLAMAVEDSALRLEVGPLEARGSTGDGPQAERVTAVLTTSSGNSTLVQIADALQRRLSDPHVLNLLNRFIDPALPGPITGMDGTCLDVAGANSANGTPVQLWTCNGTSAQQWTGASAGIRGPGPSYGSLRALGKCLDVSGAGTSNGTRVQLWECNGTNAQWWAARDADSLINTHDQGQSGKCLDAIDRRSSDGTKLQIWDCHGGANQQWLGVTFQFRGF